MAERGLLTARAVQRPLRGVAVEHQGQDTGPTREDGPILSVSTECTVAEVARSPLIKSTLVSSPEDSEYEVANMRPGVGQLEIFPTIWGHWAGGPGDSKEDVKWLDKQLGAFFEKNSTHNSKM